MTSCGGTSSTTVRRSTLTICWTTGIRKNNPGPFTAQNRAARPDELFRPAHDGAAARIEEDGGDEEQEREARNRESSDERVRHAEARDIDEDDGSHDEGDDAADAERAVRGQERFRHHE